MVNQQTETLCVGEQVDFCVDGYGLRIMDRFKYLARYNYVTKDCKVDEEITARIQAPSCTMGRLRVGT